MGAAALRQLLESLCSNAHWNYAVLWKLRPGNPIAVGKAALTGNHLWFKSDYLFTDEFSTNLLAECPEEWLVQLALGIKTILLVPIPPHGVLQLGSLDEVTESIDIVNEVKESFSAFPCSRSSTMFSNLYSGNSFQPAVIPSHTSTFTKYVKGLPVDATGHVKYEDRGDLVAFSHVKLHRDSNSDLCSIVSPFADATPYMPVEKIPLEASLNKNTVKNEVPEEDGVIQVSTLSDDVDIRELETVGSKLSELSSLLEELQAYPGCSSALDSRILGAFSGVNFSTNFCGNMSFQVSTTTVGDSIDQDIVDSFLNFPEDCEVHESLGPVLADHTHDELLNSWMMDDGCHQTLLDASVPDSYSYPCKSGIVSVGSSHPSACIIPATDSVNGNVDTTSAALKSMMESLLSSDQTDKLSNNRQPQRGQKSSSLASQRRRTKPGGNNHKSRPRDRQRIQERVKELRVLVPNGGKCSIDGLLDKTVKHMLYLTSVTDQAQLLKMWVNQGQKVKQRTNLDFKCFGEQNEYPIHVEELAHPGHLLIEVLCNERVLFLEIAHVICSLELNILKGVMQNRDNNTWAHFVVEASNGFQRLDIFWPLMQLLHRTRDPVSSKI
ncbi:Transcription factor bHLH157 [Linum grandiflorum]